MIKSGNIHATQMEGMVFDQSIVSVFPKSRELLLYLLGLLNSSIFSRLIHTVNPIANNSANYLKQIPIPLPGDSREINRLVEALIVQPKNQEYQERLNEIYQRLYENQSFLK